MKKLALALVCLVSVAFFASCGKEGGDPTINFTTGEGYISSDDTVAADTPFLFGIQAKSNPTTKELLTDCYIQIFNGDHRYWDTVVQNINRDQFNFDGMVALPEGVYTISASVRNTAEKSAECRMTITSVSIDIPLITTPVKWVRQGANVTEGAEQIEALGLKWSGSHKEIFATLEPFAGYLLYKVNANWDDIKTIKDEAELFQTVAETSLPISEFREITTAHSDDYDVILGTVTDGEMHLIHITRCEVEDLGNIGTQLTITGEAK